MVALLNRVKQALADNLKNANPSEHELVPRNNGLYVSCLNDNLIPGVNKKDFYADFKSGDGNELKGKMYAVHSSSALVVNTFARFKNSLADASLALESARDANPKQNGGPFHRLQFEGQYRAWENKSRAANLDLVAESDNYVLAIESKLTEHITPKERMFEDATRNSYNLNIRDARRDGVWFSAMNTDPYWYLDVAQLVKHALALSRTLQDKDVTLLYLYWEPENWRRFDEFKTHREEIDRFSDLVQAGFPRFQPMSYLKLWEQWEAPKQPDWLKEHTRNLRDRYGVSLQSKKQN